MREGGKSKVMTGMRIEGGSEVLKVGTLNVIGVNKKEKRVEEVMVMEGRSMDVLALTETKLTGESELSFGKY